MDVLHDPCIMRLIKNLLGSLRFLTITLPGCPFEDSSAKFNSMSTFLTVTTLSSQDGSDISTPARNNGQSESAPATLHFLPLSIARNNPEGIPLPSSNQSLPNRHIPRPANAFILFRSDFLKRGIIPHDVEQRQQNLSRIAGQVWNLLDPTEKAKWHAQAAHLLQEYRRKNPDTKTTHVWATGSSQLSNKPPHKNNMTEDEIRKIREMYIGSTPSRKHQTSHPLDTPASHTPTSEGLSRHHIESTTILTAPPQKPQTPHCVAALPTEDTPYSPPSSPNPLPRPMGTRFSPLNDFLSTASPKPRSHSPHATHRASPLLTEVLGSPGSLPLSMETHFSPLNDSIATANTLPAPSIAASGSLFSFICGCAAEVFKQ